MFFEIERLLMACLGGLLFRLYQKFGIGFLKTWFASSYHGEVFELEPGEQKAKACWSHPLLDLLFGIVLISNGLSCGFEWRLLALRWLLLLLFASVAWFDASTGLIPDLLNFSIFMVGFFHRSYQPALWAHDLFEEVNTSLYWMAPLLFSFSYFLSFVLAQYSCSLVGGGDLKFMASIVWMGGGPLTAILLSASCTAFVWARWFRPQKRDLKKLSLVVRFGPFLATSAAYCLSFPDFAYGWFQGYLQWLGGLLPV